MYVGLPEGTNSDFGFDSRIIELMPVSAHMPRMLLIAIGNWCMFDEIAWAPCNTLSETINKILDKSNIEKKNVGNYFERLN